MTARSIRILLAVALAALAIIGSICFRAEYVQQPPELSIVGFGDSIIRGPNVERPWLYTMLSRLTPEHISHAPRYPWDWIIPAHRQDDWYQAGSIRVYNAGIVGNTTTQMVKRFSQDVIDRHPDYCIILGGVNDIANGTPLDTVQSNLARLYARCKEADITPIACTLTPIKSDSIFSERRSDVIELNTWIKSYSSEHGIAVVDFYPVLASDSSGLIQADGVHPNQAGHNAMGRAVDVRMFAN